jgi:hypothetical protein
MTNYVFDRIREHSEELFLKAQDRSVRNFVHKGAYDSNRVFRGYYDTNTGVFYGPNGISYLDVDNDNIKGYVPIL